jgi:RNA-directed DNA polymerase
MHENRETSETPAAQPGRRSAGEGQSHKARAYVYEESHSGIVPMNHSNKDGKLSAESGEGRPLIKENAGQPNTYPTQSGKGVSQGLAGGRKAAKENKEMKFTALLHHRTVDLLRESFYSLKRKAAPGVDGVTWQEYENGLEDRLTDLHGRVHRGAYRAMPSRRVYIEKEERAATSTRSPGSRRQTCPAGRGYHPQPDLRGRLSRLLCAAEVHG